MNKYDTPAQRLLELYGDLVDEETLRDLYMVYYKNTAWKSEGELFKNVCAYLDELIKDAKFPEGQH